MKRITVIEHEFLPIVKEQSQGQKALSFKHSEALQKLEQKLPSNAFSWIHQGVKFANYCGVISLGNLLIEILPKIHGKETEPGACRKALIRMLIKARKLKSQKSGMASIDMQKHSLLDVFILHFCDQLHAELMQGMIRSYVARKENINVLRGRLLAEQQFKHNLAHKERLFCQYDEMSSDNAHNQVIKHVLRLMLKLTAGVMARKQVVELLMRFDPISDVKVHLQMIDKLTFNRSTCRYEFIIQQCRWFIQGLYPDVLVGNNPCLSLLFDMNRLFELYVASVFRKIAWAAGLRMREQGPQKYMVRREDLSQEVFLMKPDMAFYDTNNNIVSIADAKWKILDEREKKLGIAQSDLYQMAAYSRRYGVDSLTLIYPKQQWLQNPIKLRLKGTETMLNIMPIDITSKNLSARI